GWVLGLTSLPFFMVVLDSLIVVTALPRMEQDLHVGLSTLQWTVNARPAETARPAWGCADLGRRGQPRLGTRARQPSRLGEWRDRWHAYRRDGGSDSFLLLGVPCTAADAAAALPGQPRVLGR